MLLDGVIVNARDMYICVAPQSTNNFFSSILEFKHITYLGLNPQRDFELYQILRLTYMLFYQYNN